MLARREHSRAEIRRKLLDQGAESEPVDSLLDELAERKLQSDERFTEMFVRSRAERGYGPMAIQAELKQKGIAAEQTAAALENSGYDWFEQAKEVRTRRFGEALPSVPREKARQLRFLQYRGFGGQSLMRLLQGREGGVSE